jgi:ubiquinone/menaquinone biosynthesis C-methylase UbiE
MDAKTVAAHWEANAETWTKYSRAGYDRYRDALNTPAFLAMLPAVDGLTGLDLGCGEGTNTRKVAEIGAAMIGLDIAPTFLRHARETETADPRGIAFVLGDGITLPFGEGQFDFVTAFMSMMDMADQQAVLAEVRRVLKVGGFFQFSILHPCFVPPRRRNVRNEKGEPIAVEIADYFRETNGEVETWLFSSIPAEERSKLAPFNIPRFHRTLTSWVKMIVSAGLSIEAFGEPMADAETAAAEPTVADTRVAPIFLHIRARRLA